MGSLSTSQLIYIVLIQIILLLCTFLWYSVYQLNKTKKKLAAKPKPKPPAAKKETPKDNDLEAYLKSEADKTSQQIEYDKEHDADKDTSGLNLRLELLNFEHELVVSTSANKSPDTKTNWEDVNQKLYKILSNCGFMRNTNHLKKALENKEEEEEAVPVSESLLEQQNKTISHLKEFIDDLLSQMDSSAVPNTDLDKHFNELEQIKIELEQCVLILEDENSFLRDQISALLKLTASD